MSKRPRLRGKARAREGLYPLGEFPDDVVIGIGRSLVHRLAVGQRNITGDDFAVIFAGAINGEHRGQPLGVTDVIWNNCSWSAKTVQSGKPFTMPQVRLISGRNSPKYSYGISDPLHNIAATGDAVLQIWNQRVNQSLAEFEDLRMVVLIRNMSKLEFTLFEYEATRYASADYEWKLNKEENLVGHDKVTGKHCFTWQPHGSQFTVLKDVPGSAYRFRIKRHPGILDPEHILRLVRFEESWIQRVDQDGKPSTHDEGSGEEHDA